MKTLDLAVLERDVRRHGLRRGDIGAIVETYADGAFEVEFVMPSGDTKAVITLEPADVREVRPDDVLTVRKSRSRRVTTAESKAGSASASRRRSKTHRRAKRGAT